MSLGTRRSTSRGSRTHKLPLKPFSLFWLAIHFGPSCKSGTSAGNLGNDELAAFRGNIRWGYGVYLI